MQPNRQRSKHGGHERATNQPENHQAVTQASSKASTQGAAQTRTGARKEQSKQASRKAHTIARGEASSEASKRQSKRRSQLQSKQAPKQPKPTTFTPSADATLCEDVPTPPRDRSNTTFSSRRSFSFSLNCCSLLTNLSSTAASASPVLPR